MLNNSIHIHIAAYCNLQFANCNKRSLKLMIFDKVSQKIGFNKLARSLHYYVRPLLSRGSPSQLTLLVNSIVHTIYKPIAVLAIGYFFVF
ncbi:hypothetical protein FXE86_13835 [Vibrio mimicus]|nr:hypothetical protein FXE86_13835 [Vibrio mimicus]